MSTVYDQFIGAAAETTYATAVAPASFYEILSESIAGAYDRIESNAIFGTTLRADRFAPNPKGAAGDFEVEVIDSGFDFWLKYMLGATNTTTKTSTIADLKGLSFTTQVARVDSAGALIPFTYAGGKVTSWELSAAIDGILTAKISCDFASETIGAGTGALALATPTYPAGCQLMTFVAANIQVGGTSVPVSSVSITGDNGLKTDRYAMRGATSTTKREPIQDGQRAFGFTLDAEFEDATQINRVASATAAGALAALSLTFTSPQGGSLVLTASAGRFDAGPVNAQKGITTQQLTGKILQPTDGSSPISVVYTPHP